MSATCLMSAILRCYYVLGYRVALGPIRVYKDAARFGLEDIMQRQVEESGLDWREIATSAHNKRYRGDRPRDYNEWCKQARFLQSRGFNTDQVRFVLGDATRDL